MMNKDIEKSFSTVYEQGYVVSRDGYHRPDSGRPCNCDKITGKGAYRYMTVEYNNMTYEFCHQTPVVIQKSDTEYILNSGGYYTKTTKKSINSALPKSVKVIQRDYDWYVEIGNDILNFYNGMEIDTNMQAKES